MWKPGTRTAKIVKAIVSRILLYGGLLMGGWWWMIWTPGTGAVRALKSLTAEDAAVEGQVRSDIAFLAGVIGERNVPGKPEQLERAAWFIDDSMNQAGYSAKSQWYSAGDSRCRNVEAEIRGGSHAQEIVVVGAHYDTVPDSPGADDNASGVADRASAPRCRELAHRGKHQAPYRNPYYRTSEDTPDRIDYDRLARFTSGMSEVVRQLAHAISPP